MKTEIRDALSLRVVRWALIGIAGLFVAFLIFHAGMVVGERRAYEGLHGFGVGMPPPAMVGVSLFSHGFFPEGHGAVGTITAIALPDVTMKTRDGASETVAIDNDTVIRNPVEDLKPGDLHIGDAIIVIGDPQDVDTADLINARLIRVVGAPGSGEPSATSSAQ